MSTYERPSVAHLRRAKRMLADASALPSARLYLLLLVRGKRLDVEYMQALLGPATKERATRIEWAKEDRADYESELARAGFAIGDEEIERAEADVSPLSIERIAPSGDGCSVATYYRQFTNPHWHHLSDYIHV